MTRTHWLIIIVAFSAFVIWRFFAALIMLQFAIKRGNAGGHRFRLFIMCFLLGLPAYLYVISLPDWKVRYSLDKIVWLLERNAPEQQSATTSSLQFTNWLPEKPNKGFSLEGFLQQISSTAEKYACDRLIVVREALTSECFVCKRKRKDMKYCRIIHNGTHRDVAVCANCIDAFVICNPDSVFDLDSLEIK